MRNALSRELLLQMHVSACPLGFCTRVLFYLDAVHRLTKDSRFLSIALVGALTRPVLWADMRLRTRHANLLALAHVKTCGNALHLGGWEVSGEEALKGVRMHQCFESPPGVGRRQGLPRLHAPFQPRSLLLRCQKTRSGTGQGAWSRHMPAPGLPAMP